MENIIVSVVIPFYNTEKELLDRCVKSVLQQTYTNFECLIIDDGSKLEYASFLDEFSRIDSRIIVQHKENGGLGSARNYGISRAKGDYIFFLDSDDYISKYTLEIGVRTAFETDADMIIGGLIHVLGDEDPGFQQKPGRKVVITDCRDKVAFVMQLSGIKQKEYSVEVGQIGPSACGRFIKKGVAIEIPFENDKFWDEDNLWNISAADRCSKIIVLDLCWYAYVINPNSMIRGYAGDRSEEFEVRAKQEYILIKKLFPDCIQGAYYHIWDGMLRYCRTDSFQRNNPQSNQNKYLNFCKAIDFEEFKEAIKKIDFNYEKRFKYRLIKKTIKRFLLFRNKKLAYILLGECIKRIKY